MHERAALASATAPRREKSTESAVMKAVFLSPFATEDPQAFATYTAVHRLKATTAHGECQGERSVCGYAFSVAPTKGLSTVTATKRLRNGVFVHAKIMAQSARTTAALQGKSSRGFLSRCRATTHKLAARNTVPQYCREAYDTPRKVSSQIKARAATLSTTMGDAAACGAGFPLAAPFLWDMIPGQTSAAHAVTLICHHIPPNDPHAASATAPAIAYGATLLPG